MKKKILFTLSFIIIVLISCSVESSTDKLEITFDGKVYVNSEEKDEITNVEIPLRIKLVKVKAIKEYGFYNCRFLIRVVIENGCEIIEPYAFYNCYQLNEITVSETICSIGTNTFCGCKKLKTINYSGTKEQWDAIEKGRGWLEYECTLNYDGGSEVLSPE